MARLPADGECTSLRPLDAAKTNADRKREEEEKILAAQSAAQKALGGAEEIAKGIVYTERMTTSYASA